MTSFLSALGARVIALDLGTHGKMIGDVCIEKADINRSLPVDSSSADYILCQEGIEHLPNQYACLVKFARILKYDGRLILTAPTISNFRARVASALVEYKSFNRLHVNEFDDMESNSDGEALFGHMFLVGAQHLRALGRAAGLRLVMACPTRLSVNS